MLLKMLQEHFVDNAIHYKAREGDYMSRIIKGLLFQVRFESDWGTKGRFVECSDKTDLYRYIAEREKEGLICLSACQIYRDGSRPRVAFRGDKEFKSIYKSL